MSWLSTLLIAGSVFISGTELPSSHYTNYTNTKINSKKIVTSDETERFEQTYPFDPNGKISVSNLNGSITVEAWDNPQIYLEAVKIANSKERLSDVSIDIQAGQSSFAVKTDYKSWKNRNWNDRDQNYGKLEVNFRLKVPRTAVLNEIESVNGSVKVSDMTNYTEISAVNGSVTAANLRGTAKLSTVNGSVNVDFDQLSSDAVISLGTVNGSVRLAIPSTANATLRADTVNGSINNEFGLPVRKGKYVGRDLYGRIGTGEVKIKLNSVNGGLYINRKNDGGTPNPAVNLLPQKDSDDFEDTFDTEFDENFNVNVGKLNKTAQKAARDAKREAAKVRVSEKQMADIREKTRAEIARVQPELEKLNEEALKIAEEAIERERIRERIETRGAEFAQLADTVRLARAPYIVEKTGSFDVEGTPKVSIRADNCSVTVRGWDKPEVKYSITRAVRDRSGEPPQVSISNNKRKGGAAETGSDVEIEVVSDDASGSELLRNGANSVRVEVFVPKKSNIRIQTNREIRLEGVTGELELIGEDDSINVRDSSGTLNLNTNSGLVRVIGFDGEVISETDTADIMLEGKFRKISATGDTGRIYLTVPAATDAMVEVCGNVEVENSAQTLVRQNETTLKFGKGGAAAFNFKMDSGKLYVRPQSSLYTN